MGMGMRAMARLGGGIAATALAAFVAAPAMAQDILGQPTPAGLGLQTAASPIMHEAAFFHDWVLMPVITAICVLVAVLLVWIVIRYNKRSNPVPAKWSHNTLIEVIWTVVPVLILVAISLFSFRLLFAYHDYPDADITVKITGNQWNWGYEYPDQGVAEYISNMLPEDKTPKHLYRLAADEPMVVPVGENVRLLITASDVIHAVAVPSFGIKVDAVPGRMNESWFRAEKEGDFYGQCSELCGVDHAFMPIHVKVVSKEAFAAWVASKGGSMTKAADEAAAAAVPVAAEAPAAPADAAAAPTDAASAAPATAAAPAAPAAQ